MNRMPCNHIKELYQLVDQYDMKLASSDPIRILCPLCNKEETCPDRLMDEISEDADSSPQAAEGEMGTSVKDSPS